jgi:hypothetical protein
MLKGYYIGGYHFYQHPQAGLTFSTPSLLMVRVIFPLLL